MQDEQNTQSAADAPELEAKVGAGETATEATDAAQDAPEVMPSLEELLKAAELKAAEHHDAWLRAKAETENVRRRAQEDIAKAHKFASEKFASELLAVKDSLEAALANEAQTVETLKAGVELTLKQLAAAFEKSAIVEINPVGEKFDPHKHQAIAMVDAEQEANTVVSVLQKGYALHERILRPALVTVAKPKA
ncbi:MAG: nucleotide exchange factor GrpE [Rhodocyclaceae bacterium]|jgi:molecular chaperone GrpE|nr:nucleotide exchange factor GrpE [Rhodocyclaceae bacterium]